MASSEVENSIGFVDDRRLQNDLQRPGNTGSATYVDVGDLRTYLAASTAHGVGHYSSARLDNMTKNDMVYAARLIQDAGGIN